MIKMREKIENFLNEWKVEGREDSYMRFKIVEQYDLETGDFENVELEFETELEDLLARIDGVKYNYICVGGFESPGYEIDCCCLTIVDENDNLFSFPINFESF